MTTEAKTLHIFGTNISKSLSPTIHNAAFAHHSLPHTYTIEECASLSDPRIQSLLRSSSFGGASVTMPHKLTAFDHCASTSDSANRIGAINTLIPTSTGIRGDNTDWSGLYALITEYEPSSNPNPNPDSESESKDLVGLVIGAGGAARAAVYAMLQARFSRVIIANRTLAKAERIIADFADLESGAEMRAVQGLEGLRASGLGGDVDVVIGTIPGTVTTEKDFEGLLGKSGGLCVEMAYTPKVTPLMRVVGKQGWVVRDGLEVLLRQAFVQYGLWTGRGAPEGVMRGAIGED
ncbi:NAD(P)-binding protein [Aspergillus ellipticus CBS 707.79]|uniref:NAD(P)-binding protein n=1 Tax=Aspergillus ellipticus CBS 707.79 TaxID=1448320 RepID=A0A319CU09_9EURO|nr:NAD(P)-binding protein [Aspergillus ellipticus CBS 707.79]